MNTRLIPLAALQHYAFCPRQCALIHNERVWAENYLTAQGQVLHQRVDSGEPENRKGILYERGVLVSAPRLGLTGKLDLLEKNIKTCILTPVEYKRGKPKKGNCDEVQLCAQALCLEEMTGKNVEFGALWYWQTRHREVIAIDEALRRQTLAFIDSVAAIFASGITPKANFGKHCQACSLINLCEPKQIQNDASLKYINALFKTGDEQ